MAIKDKLAAKAAPFLADGEVVQQAFRARVMLPGTQLAKATYVVIGTQHTIKILQTSIWSTTTPRTLRAEVPKGAPVSLDKARGMWWRLRIGDQQIGVAGKASLTEARQLVNTGEQPAA
jgi:hypothetical protein